MGMHKRLIGFFGNHYGDHNFKSITRCIDMVVLYAAVSGMLFLDFSEEFRNMLSKPDASKAAAATSKSHRSQHSVAAASRSSSAKSTATESAESSVSNTFSRDQKNLILPCFDKRQGAKVFEQRPDMLKTVISELRAVLSDDISIDLCRALYEEPGGAFSADEIEGLLVSIAGFPLFVHSVFRHIAYIARGDLAKYGFCVEGVCVHMDVCTEKSVIEKRQLPPALPDLSNKTILYKNSISNADLKARRSAAGFETPSAGTSIITASATGSSNSSSSTGTSTTSSGSSSDAGIDNGRSADSFRRPRLWHAKAVVTPSTASSVIHRPPTTIAAPLPGKRVSSTSLVHDFDEHAPLPVVLKHAVVRNHDDVAYVATIGPIPPHLNVYFQVWRPGRVDLKFHAAANQEFVQPTVDRRNPWSSIPKEQFERRAEAECRTWLEVAGMPDGACEIISDPNEPSHASFWNDRTLSVLFPMASNDAIFSKSVCLHENGVVRIKCSLQNSDVMSVDLDGSSFVPKSIDARAVQPAPMTHHWQPHAQVRPFLFIIILLLPKFC
jgi:hypothetical protein